jgi:hypothetical protein
MKASQVGSDAFRKNRGAGMSDFQSEYFEDFQSMTDREAFEEDDFDGSGTGYSSDAFNEAAFILRFIERTPELTASEQAELLGAYVEEARRSRRVDWGRVARGVQTGLSLFQTGAQIAGGIAGAVGGNNRTARNISLWSRRLGQGAGLAQNLLGNIRPGHPPRMPTGVQQGRRTGRPYLRGHATPAAPTGRHPPARSGTTAQTGTPGRIPLNNTAQLASLLNNPQIMQALRSALFRGREGTLHIEADVSGGMPVEIPMGDAMAAIARLAGESALELNTLAGEEAARIPDYLVSEDGEYIVDPACDEARGALILENLRRQGEFDRYNALRGDVEIEGLADNEVDASEVWAREAGFDG